MRRRYNAFDVAAIVSVVMAFETLRDHEPGWTFLFVLTGALALTRED